MLERRYDDALSLFYEALASSYRAPLGEASARIDPTFGTLHIVASAAVLALMWDRAEQNDRAAEFRREVAAALERIRGDADSSRGALYDRCDQLLALLPEPPHWKDVHWCDVPEELHTVKNFVASNAVDATPDVAIVLQLIAIERFADALRAFPTIRAWVVVPALLAYWRNRVASQGFLFIAPAHVLAELQQIIGSDERALRKLLSVVVDGTRPQGIPARCLAWLRGVQ